MPNVKVFDKEFEITDAGQVINMGGPWIGVLKLKEQVISEDCIVDNFISDEVNRRLFFVKYYSTSSWASGVYFTINIYDIDYDVVFESETHFKMVHIEQLIDSNCLEIYHAFHDKSPGTRLMFNLNEEKFFQVK